MNVFKLLAATFSVSLIGGTVFFVDCNITNKVCVAPASVLSTSIDITEPSPTNIIFPTLTSTPAPTRKKIYPTKSPLPTAIPTQGSVQVQNTTQTNFVWPTMKPLPTLYLPPNTTSDALKKMQEVGNAPLVVPTIDASIHINNPEPTSAVPFGFSN